MSTIDIQFTGQDAAPMSVSTPPQGAPQAIVTGNAPVPHQREFEKAQVGSSVVKISGACAVDTFDETVSLDDRLRVVGEFRVVKVNHYVAKDGSIVREQVLAPCGDLALVPWDPSNPGDDGIVRARP
jgi:hypothetical protein